MEKLMLGTEVALQMKEELLQKAEGFRESGIQPHLSILRVGEKPEDLSYERGAKKRMEMVHIDCSVIELAENVSQGELENTLQKENEDPTVHGILILQPLPKHLDVEPLKKMIRPDKDVDGMSPINIAKVMEGDESGHGPCTAEAVMEMLHRYKVSLEGKKVVILGRSMVVGKPLSMMLLNEHATVTICHSRTPDLAEECRRADVLVAAVGKAKFVTADMVKEGAVVVDVGINVDEEGKLCGDVNFEEVEKKASLLSPVPKGVGSVTTSMLAKHVLACINTP